MECCGDIFLVLAEFGGGVGDRKVPALWTVRGWGGGERGS